MSQTRLSKVLYFQGRTVKTEIQKISCIRGLLLLWGNCPILVLSRIGHRTCLKSLSHPRYLIGRNEVEQNNHKHDERSGNH